MHFHCRLCISTTSYILVHIIQLFCFWQYTYYKSLWCLMQGYWLCQKSTLVFLLSCWISLVVLLMFIIVCFLFSWVDTISTKLCLLCIMNYHCHQPVESDLCLGDCSWSLLWPEPQLIFLCCTLICDIFCNYILKSISVKVWLLALYIHLFGQISGWIIFDCHCEWYTGAWCLNVCYSDAREFSWFGMCTFK